MGSDDPEQIPGLLRRRLLSLSEQVLAGEEISPQEFEKLEQLARLTELGEAAKPSSKRKRWPIVVLFIGTLAPLSILLFAEVSSTEIEMEARASEVRFDLTKRPQVFLDELPVSSLIVSGLEEISLPRATGEAARTVNAEDGSLFVALSAASADDRSGSLTLSALTLPAETIVWIRGLRNPGRYRITLEAEELVIRVSVYGSVEVKLADGSKQLDFASPRSFQLRAGSNGLDLDLDFRTTDAIFSTLLEASDLAFYRVDELVDEEETMVRRLSTIESGTIYFESLSGENLQLRPGEEIRFEESEGQIRSLQLRDNGIDLRFGGRVVGMATGPSTNRRSLMPTYLDWLSAQARGLAIVWGMALYFFGLVQATMQWWGK